MRKLVALILSIACVGTTFVSCNKDDNPSLSGQTIADKALKKATQQLAAAKQSFFDFGMEITGKDAGEETARELVSVDGDVSLYALEDSLAWGAEFHYDENTTDKLFASNTGVGRYVENLDTYESVEMLPITANTFQKAFEETALSLFDPILETTEDSFRENLSMTIMKNAVREDNLLTLTYEITDKAYAEDLLLGFMCEGAVITQSSFVATLVLDKEKGIEDFNLAGGFSAEITDKTAKCFGRNVQLADGIDVSFAWDLTGFSKQEPTNLPQVESMVFPLYSEDWLPVFFRSKAKVLSFTFTLERIDGELYYVIEARLRYHSTYWQYEFVAPASTTRVSEVEFRLRDYMRKEGEREAPYEITDDFESSELVQTVTFNWTTKEANFKAFNMYANWTGGY